MYHNFINKIGSSSYLNKSNGLYIPFDLQMQGTNYTLIQQILNTGNQMITYRN
jgi:hypothetical protein